jgi:peptidoglycan/xylan/chitin deacetylase (PgdA/CDA1 family)
LVNLSGKYVLLFLFFLCGCNNTQKEINSIKIDTLSKTLTVSDSIKTRKPEIFSPGIITKLPSEEKIIALTFDACETKTPAYLDEGILSYLIEEKIPFTIFVSGKFAMHNKERLREISELDFVEVENHSLNHFQHMERLTDEKVKSEVLENEKIISDITGKKTKFFRFPGGNFNQRVLDDVESIGYKVVHWRVPGSDPEKRVSTKNLTRWVLYCAEPGDILIFHINGRGYKTAKALPIIVEQLREKEYRFVKLEEYIK